MSNPVTYKGEIQDITTLWDRLENHGTDYLTDTELRMLFRWCEWKEICLPPAGSVYDAMVERGLVNLEGQEIEK